MLNRCLVDSIFTCRRLPDNTYGSLHKITPIRTYRSTRCKECQKLHSFLVPPFDALERSVKLHTKGYILMLVREWKCTCPTETATDFMGYLNETGVKDTQSIDGCCGYKIMKREVASDVEITFVTLWETFDQMKIYAGENLYNAVLYPEDYLYKITSDTEVKIYKLVAEGSATEQCKMGSNRSI